jgi:hypothetical protein
MATKLLSTKGSYDFHKYTDIEIETIESHPDVASNKINVGSRKQTVSSEVYHIDQTQEFPQTPPEFVMSSEFLKMLVADGSVTVQ